jgi:CRP-like cAMP-binding protein
MAQPGDLAEGRPGERKRRNREPLVSEPHIRNVPVNNRILRAIANDSFERLSPSLKPVQLPHGRVVAAAGESVDEIFFVESGLVSLVQRMANGRVVEVAAIGPEGVTAPFALCGLHRIGIEQIVQIPVSAWRISFEAIHAELVRNPEAQQLIQGYSRYLIGQIAQISACNRLHTLKQRCCRWLLTASDCAQGDSFYLTHEFLSEMLGVYRSAVSTIAVEFREAGMVEYRHGTLKVLDRQGLEGMACECYLQNRNDQDSVFTT